MSDFKAELKKRIECINGYIEEFLPAEEGLQRKIFESANYSVRNGGKRIRPMLMESAYILCMKGRRGDESYEELIASPEYDAALIRPFMAAIEMIHSSSLVHDDLPCMDNDLLRRGKPSTWAKYGEGMGTLAGDALMIYAFETACKAMNGCGGSAEDHAEGERAFRVVRAIKIIAEKTGIYGMIGGQTVDVLLTGQRPTEEQLDFIYRLKTGALLEASVMTGAVLAGADEDTVKKLEQAAGRLGMAFQIKDDILDENSTEEELGKPVHSDERNEKYTYVTLHGQDDAAKKVEELTREAVEATESVGSYWFLTELYAYLMDRRN